jgi:hypothetical protein
MGHSGTVGGSIESFLDIHPASSKQPWLWYETIKFSRPISIVKPTVIRAEGAVLNSNRRMRDADGETRRELYNKQLKAYIESKVVSILG